MYRQIHRTAIILFAGLSIFSLGCTTIIVPNPGSVTSPVQPAYTNLTGNWEFALTPLSGAVPYPILSGSLVEQTSGSNGSYGTTAALRGQDPTNCFLGAVLVPLQGSSTKTSLSVYGFAINYQYVSIATTTDATYTHLNGTYGIGGGCASGNNGTLVGTRYAVMTGTYSGSTSANNSAAALKLSITQSANDNGDGLFPVSGSALFTGVSCFNQATLQPNSSTVSGSSVNLVFTAPGGDKVILIGNIDPSAATLTAKSIVISSGNCAGSLGTATLLAN